MSKIQIVSLGANHGNVANLSTLLTLKTRPLR